MQIGFIGLGKMGSRMVLKLLEDGHQVSVWNRSLDTVENFKFQISNLSAGLRLRGSDSRSRQGDKLKQHIQFAKTIQELIENLPQPRIVWSMLPAGDVTEQSLYEVEKFVQAGDIVIDGGNAHFTDTERRYKEYKKKGIKFLGIGVSGGVRAVENGFPLMAGGDRSAFEMSTPILETLSKPHGDFTYLGEGGAGHFVKMVHNAIEYGMMQSIAEGFEILEKAPYPLNLLQVAKVYQKGSIISSFLMDRTVDALAKDGNLSSKVGIIAESGEAKWAIEQARKENVDVGGIEYSLAFRRKSQTNKKVQNSFSAKLIAALRHEFGGHEVKTTK